MKMLITILFFAISWQLFALPSYVEFSPNGTEKDRYADGSIVKDGELYACIWIKDGCSFSGITAEGHLVDSVNNKLIGAAPLAENGRCKPVVFMLNGENSNLENGSFEIYLLDTRSRQKQNDIDLPSNVFKNNTPGFVNSWQLKAATQDIIDHEFTDVTGKNTPSVIPPDTPMPVIKSIQIHNGKVIINIGNTVPFIRYTVSSGPTPQKTTIDGKISATNGTENGDLTLVLDQTKDAKFFKIVRE